MLEKQAGCMGESYGTHEEPQEMHGVPRTEKTRQGRASTKTPVNIPPRRAACVLGKGPDEALHIVQQVGERRSPDIKDGK